ncbi:snurportin-1-like [Planoprotostelium fungivorum]|uniref:Snurportin-1 n=1 Tax=Planoprotostelium fungivorum TaxID=1890364 RepID=A0A2P6NJ00_9EUKA|nr:snurportin-1-like [Planoprotostelium fungivorum]
MEGTTHRTSVKNRGKSDQEKRREEALRSQQEARRSVINNARRITSIEDVAIEGNFTDMVNVQTDQTMMEVSSADAKAKRQEAIEAKRSTFWKDRLMQPEPLNDIPSDLKGGWMCVPYPVETERCLIITTPNITTARRSSDGTIFCRFRSRLPPNTLLDAAVDMQNNIVYVLDLMSWNGHLYYDCSTDFRFFWLNNKLTEEDYTSVSRNNEFVISPLPSCEVDWSDLNAAATRLKGVQSVLLYSKATHYTPGVTPLMCHVEVGRVQELFDQLMQ